MSLEMEALKENRQQQSDKEPFSKAKTVGPTSVFSPYL